MAEEVIVRSGQGARSSHDSFDPLDLGDLIDERLFDTGPQGERGKSAALARADHSDDTRAALRLETDELQIATIPLKIVADRIDGPDDASQQFGWLRLRFFARHARLVIRSRSAPATAVCRE